MELRDLLAVAWKRRVAVLLVLVLTLGLAAVFAYSQPKRYESVAVLALTPDPNAGAGLLAADNLAALLGTYAQTAKSTIMLRRAERALGGPLDAEIDTSTEAGTGILRISAVSTDPESAAAAMGRAALGLSERFRTLTPALSGTIIRRSLPARPPCCTCSTTQSSVGTPHNR